MSSHPKPLFESLESRQFLSTSFLHAGHGHHGHARPHLHARGHARTTAAFAHHRHPAAAGARSARLAPHAGYASPVGKTPAQVRKAYGVDSIVFGSVVGDGSGQTIAIIDAYDNPSLVSSIDADFAISDLARFDRAFGLPDPPSFTKVSQTGSRTSLPAYDAGWAGEIALDVEWAHVMAPRASILLVEAKSASLSNLNAAVSYAKKQPGVSVISMSYGMAEFSGETSYDGVYTTPSGHAGVTFFASTGDSGAPGSYQAYSPNVVAVGGTSLYLADSSGTYGSESGWSGAGGGISSYEPKPSYQSSMTLSSSRRTTPDVAALANPSTGVAILNTAATGIGSAGGWMQIGGTSLSAPLWAGMMAVADQGRALLGLSPLDGRAQTLPRLYALDAADFHDVTTGSNGGYSAGAGYDLVTGRGTPRADRLIPDLAGGATIAGSVFDDADADGVRDAGETYVANATVYLDLDGDGARDAAEPASVTGASGAYSFSDLLGRVAYTVRAVIPSGYLATTPTSLALSSLYGTTTVGDFGLAVPPRTSFGGQALTLRLDSTATQLQVFTNAAGTGAPAYTLSRNLASAATFAGTAGDDLFAVDLTNGNPLAVFSVSYDGAGGSDTVAVRGTAGADVATFSDTAITLDGATLAAANTESATFDGRGGADALAVAGPVPLVLGGGQKLGSLTLLAGARAVLTPGRNLLYTRALSVASTASLDLADGTLVVDDPAAGAESAVRSYLTTGYDGGAWDGYGIRSSAAAGDATEQTALGYGTAASLGISSYGGIAVAPTAVMVRYTYYGDATLDGRVDADDLALTDRGRARGLSGWIHGDFNYDGTTTSPDLMLLNQPLQASAPPIV